MKKKLLLGALLVGSVFTAKAQETISFESEEGFTLGTIHNQNGWTVTEAGAGTGVYLSEQNITDAYASDGTYSLQIAADTEFPPQENAVVGATSPTLQITGDQIEFSFDIFMDVDEDPETDTADLDFYAVSAGEGFVVARVKFNWEGNIFVLDEVDGTLNFYDSGVAWTPDAWQTVRIEIDFTAGLINYYLDDIKLLLFFSSF